MALARLAPWLRDSLGWRGWTQITVLPAGAVSLGDLWGPTPTDIWATAESGVLHWNGTSWQSPYTGLSKVTSLWGSGNDLWVGGPSGAILHRRF